MTRFYGRGQLLRQIGELHTKSVPDHVSIVGPRSIGKSMLLKAVAEQHLAGSTVFAATGLVDLRHDPPTTVDGVLARIAVTIRDALTASSRFAELARFVQPSDSATEINEQLGLAIGEIASAGARLLLILDGCDPILQNSTIPRNLWDNLRALAQSKGLRLMTGTRAPLHELCYNPDARTSDFFRIFYDQPLAVGPFDEEDWADAFARSGVDLDASAQKELRNWTGGHPDLVDLMLERLRDTKKVVSKTEVDAVAEGVLDGSARLESIWSDCSDETRGDILLLSKDDVSAGELPEPRAKYLLTRGIAVRSGTKLRLCNRLIERKAASRKNDVSGIRQLFGDRDGFNANISKLLELRAAIVSGADHEMTRIVQRSIRHLPDDPSACLSGARDLLDRALDLVWACEAPDGVVPRQWLESWKFQQTQEATKAVDRFSRERELPSERGFQCELLRLATGRQRVKPVTLKTSKAAYVLIEHVKQLGDLKNHSKAPATQMLAAAFCMTAIELCETLARELGPAA